MGAREYGVRARGYGVGSEDIGWEPEDMVTLVILVSSQFPSPNLIWDCIGFRIGIGSRGTGLGTMA